MAMDTHTDTPNSGKRVGKEELLELHNAQVAKQHESNGSGGDPRSVKRPDLDRPYPASTTPVRELEKITLRSLVPDTHHQGKSLILRTVALPLSGVGTSTVVEDGDGDVDLLVIFAHSDSSILSNIPEGCFVTVKEPYYRKSAAAPSNDTMGGEMNFISVDHPSDIVLLRFGDPVIAASFKADLVKPLLSSLEEWKAAGDASFLQGDLATAAFCYTEALDFATPESEKTAAAAIFTKRAGTNLLLGRYDAARDDAIASMTGRAGDWRAHLTAAKASYALWEFRTALSHLNAALQLNPGAAGLVKEQARTLTRIHEEDTGEYDFPALAATLSYATPTRVETTHLDIAGYFRRSEVRGSTTHGRGLFSVEDIRAGEVVFVEKATVMPAQYDGARSSAALYAGMVRRMYDSPTLAARVSTLFCDEDGSPVTDRGSAVKVVDGMPVVDVFRVELMRIKNCFSCPLTTVDNTRPTPNHNHGPADPQAKGIWPYAAAMNHACVANTARAFAGDVLITRASRDVHAGEELTQQYVPARADWEARQGQFRKWWGFDCGCVLCAAERDAGGDGAERRRVLLAQIEKIADRSAKEVEKASVGVLGDGKGASDGTVRNIERLARLLEEAHDEGVYGPNKPGRKLEGRLLPRLMLVFPRMWLLEAYRGRKNHVKVVEQAGKLLRNFGLVAEGDMGRLFQSQPRDSAMLMAIHSVRALKCAAEAWAAMGRREEADQWDAAARFGFKILAGWENDPAVLMG